MGLTRRRIRRVRRRLRPLLVPFTILAFLLLLGAALLGWQGLQAKQDLEQARDALTAAQTAATDGDSKVARAQLDIARSAASDAHDTTDGPLWSLYARLPLTGPVVTEARGLAAIADELIESVLTPLVDAMPSPEGWQGKIDVDAVRRTAPALQQADTSLAGLRRRIAALPVSRVEPLDRARDELAESLEELATDVREAAVAGKVLPALFGADGPKRLLLVAQNNAEARATGGLVGAYAILTTLEGAFALETTGSNVDLRDAAEPVVDLGPDFTARYGRAQAASTWRSANLAPDLRDAGAILAGLSQRQLGVHVDAVILVDPPALARILRATGPVAVPSLGSLSAENAVPLLLKDIYARYPGAADDEVRDGAFTEALKAVVARLQQPVAGGGLVKALRDVVASGHLQVYATDPAVEADLLRSRVSGALPSTGPFLSLITQDVGGSKLDYYLEREVSYVSAPSSVAIDLGQGAETVEDAVITVRLRNAASPTGLPAYVTARADDARSSGSGQLKSWVSVYLGPRSSYSSATLNGRRVSLSSEGERGLTVLSTYVTIDPGQTVTLVLKVVQPAVPESTLLWRQQPRLAPDSLVVRREGSATGSRSYYAGN